MDSGHPSTAAGVYDYLLDGKDNYQADRDAVEELLARVPEAKVIAQANRTFMNRSVAYVAGQGVRQFLDIGSGYPTSTVLTVHEVAQGVHHDARVVYVDNDPAVAVHGRALLAGENTRAIEADLRNPTDLLNQAGQFLDFSEPVGLLLVAVLHFLTEADDPAGCVATLRGALAPGSYLVLSHGTASNERIEAALDLYAQRVNIDPTARTIAHVRQFFSGFELVPPGLVPVSRWYSPEVNDGVAKPHQNVTDAVLGGVGRLSRSF